jgi:hypothetical protein
MVWHQRPGMAPDSPSWEIRPDFFQKENPIGIIEKNVPLLDPAGINMVHCSGKVDSRSPWHESGGFKNRTSLYAKARLDIIKQLDTGGNSTRKEAGADEECPCIGGVL